MLEHPRREAFLAVLLPRVRQLKLELVDDDPQALDDRLARVRLARLGRELGRAEPVLLAVLCRSRAGGLVGTKGSGAGRTLKQRAGRLARLAGHVGRVG